MFVDADIEVGDGDSRPGAGDPGARPGVRLGSGPCPIRSSCRRALLARLVVLASVPVRCWRRCSRRPPVTIRRGWSRWGGPGLPCGADSRRPREFLPTARGSPTIPDREAWDAAITEKTADHAPDLVVSAGSHENFGAQFLSRFSGRVVQHPSRAPLSFPGAHAVPEALAYGVKVMAVPSTWWTPGWTPGRFGPEGRRGADGDTEETLHERIKVVERRLLVEVLAALAMRGVTWSGRMATLGMVEA